MLQDAGLTVFVQDMDELAAADIIHVQKENSNQLVLALEYKE